jgi:flavin-binding monooxygenase-like protein
LAVRTTSRTRPSEGSERLSTYRISLPFLAPDLLHAQGRRLPLYRRIVRPGLDGLFLAGFVDAPSGLLPIVEAQRDWIAAVLESRLALPGAPAMLRAIERSERRTRVRFPSEPPDSIRCDPHAYRRLLRSDLRLARMPGSWARMPGMQQVRWRPLSTSTR